MVGFLGTSPLLLVTLVLMVVAAVMGAAAEWLYAGKGVDPHLIRDKAPGMSKARFRRLLSDAIVADVETARSAANVRSMLGRIGGVLQVAALVFLLVAVAVGNG